VGGGELNQTTKVYFKINTVSYAHTFYVFPSKYTMLLGNEFLKLRKPLIDYHQQSIKFKDGTQIPIKTNISNSPDPAIALLNHIQIPGYEKPTLIKIAYLQIIPSSSYSKVALDVTGPLPDAAQVCILWDKRFLQDHNIHLPNMYYKPKRRYRVFMCNLGSKQRLNAGTTVGKIYLPPQEEVAEIHSLDFPPDESAKPLRPTKMKTDQIAQIKLAEDLTEPQFKGAMKLLTNYADVFAWCEDDIGHYRGPYPSCWSLFPMEKDVKPIQQKPYKSLFKERELIRELMDSLVRHGVASYALTEWTSPVVLVQKPDGGKRVCVDYRKINSLTKDIAIQLPSIDDLYEYMSRANYISCMDIYNRYWTFDVSEEDRMKTGVATADGTVVFNRLAQGAKNSPALFVQMLRFSII